MTYRYENVLLTRYGILLSSLYIVFHELFSKSCGPLTILILDHNYLQWYRLVLITYGNCTTIGREKKCRYFSTLTFASGNNLIFELYTSGVTLRLLSGTRLFNAGIGHRYKNRLETTKK